MKKFKLISSLSALAVLATATPTIVTSCSCSNKESIYEVDNIEWDHGNPQINQKSILEVIQVTIDGKTYIAGKEGSTADFIIQSAEIAEGCDSSLNFNKDDMSITPSEKGVKKLVIKVTICEKGSTEAKTYTVECNIVIADGNYVVYDNQVIDLANTVTQEEINKLIVKEDKTIEKKTYTLPSGETSDEVDVITHVNYWYEIVQGEKFDPSKLTEIAITKNEGNTAIEIPSGFLGAATNLKKVDLSGLKVSKINAGFLLPFDETDIDIGIDELIEMWIAGTADEDEAFLLYKQHVEAKTNACFGNLTYIKLPELVASDIVSNDSIWDTQLPVFFLAGQTKLNTIDLTNIKNVNVIPMGFMIGCTSIKNVDFSMMQHINQLYCGFMSGCSNLGTIKLPKLERYTTLLENDTAPEIVQVHCPYIEIGKITSGSFMGFLNGCSKIKNIDFTPFAELEVIPNSFFGGACALNDSKLAQNPDLKALFEQYNKPFEMTSIDLSPLTKVTTIGRNFLDFGYNLTNVTLPTLVNDSEGNAPTIDTAFMNNCKALKTIDLTPLASVAKIPNAFMMNCESLTELDLTQITSLPTGTEHHVVGYGFVLNCNGLKKIKTGNLSANSFISGASSGQWAPFKMFALSKDPGASYQGIKIEGTYVDTIKNKFKDLNGPDYWRKLAL